MAQNQDAPLSKLKNSLEILQSLTLKEARELRNDLNDPSAGPDIRNTLSQIVGSVQEICPDISPQTPTDVSVPLSEVVGHANEVGDPGTRVTRRKSPTGAAVLVPTPAYEFTLLFAVHKRDNNRPVEHKRLVTLLTAFDPATKSNSITTKRSRLRDRKFLEWVTAKDLKILPDGVEEMNRLKEYLTPEDRTAIVAAFKSAWTMDVILD